MTRCTVHLAGATVLAALMTLLTFTAVGSAPPGAAVGSAPSGAAVAITPARAQEFLARLNRPKRNVWDRSRPDVQQWIQQFMYMGFDEQRLESDLAYWLDQARGRDQGAQHHYDENAPLAHGDPSAYRHGANVNYDDY